MRRVTNRVASLVVAMLIGAAVFGQIANGVAVHKPSAHGPRFTLRIRSWVNSRHCPEDNYKAVLAVRPSASVSVHDPLLTICVSREGDGWGRAR